MRARHAAATVLALALVAAACSGDEDSAGRDDARDTTTTDTAGEAAALPEGYEGYTSELYADDANWLCKPGKQDDVCARDLGRRGGVLGVVAAGGVVVARTGGGHQREGQDGGGGVSSSHPR